MDRQLFPSLIIATASMRPVEDDKEAEAPDPYMLGDHFGVVGVSIKAPVANAQVKVTLKENDLMAETTWSGELPEAGKHYAIAPKVNFKFDRLRKVTQQVPMNVAFEVDVEGEFVGKKRRRFRCIRSTIARSPSVIPRKRWTTKTLPTARGRWDGCLRLM